ncbi:MAG: hypothetical protein AMXMBFR55_30590 [Gemmatimonadota bacterium]
MWRNVGTLDRAIRVVVGIALLTFALAGERTTWWALIGIFPLGTGLTGICPLYRYLNVSTVR